MSLYARGKRGRTSEDEMPGISRVVGLAKLPMVLALILTLASASVARSAGAAEPAEFTESQEVRLIEDAIATVAAM